MEKKYFYNDGANPQGPFSLEELKYKNITKTTLVWFQGLGDWQPAGTLPELATLFYDIPPFQSTPPNIPNPQNMPKTWLVQSILATLFCCLPFGIVGIVYAARVDSAYMRGDYGAALHYSQQAGYWTKISFWLGISAYVIYLVCILIFGMSNTLFNL